MAAIADDWLALAADEPMGAREAQVCVDVLCAILRAAPADQPAADKTEEPSDQPVRSMIIHIIASHLRRDTEPSWRQLRFDLKGAHLHDVNLSECHFQGSLILANAHLSGEQATFTDSHFANVTFDHATFQTGTTAEFTHTTWDTTAVFQYTEFGGNLNFDRANFNAGASFTGASLGTRVGAASEASFKEAEFVGTADFTYARVYCSMAEFYGATFNGPALFKRLQANQPEKSASISFHSATFHGPADFEACHVGSHTDFRESKFLGDLKTPTALDDTYFDSEEAVRFNDAEFVVAEFDKAQFSRQVSFYGAKWIFEARFPSAKFTAPVRFEKTTFHNGATFVGVEFVCGADFYRVDFGDQPVDFTNPAVWNDVRVDWDGSSPFHSSVPPQPSNVLPEDWTSNRASERRPATRT
ncbi:pentapeptide repeat-containing protein [Mycobacteroides sp. LB1]|uniref:pentapeptide repeat-containing protein n=1 Tax=Mycobacteroides sp. LB1 TaxID=2750814 RepID=UPI002103A4AA